MKKYLVLMITVLLAVSVIFSGCTKDTPEEDAVPSETTASETTKVEVTPEPEPEPVAKEITWARAYESTSLDPTEAADDQSLNIVSYINEGLLRVVNGELVPGIAETWEVADDNVTYTLNLRESVWSDGTPLTAYDFEYAFYRLINPEAGHAQASGGYSVLNAQEYAEGTADIDDVGYKALDDYTLEVTFKATSLENLYSFAGETFFPVNQALAEEVETAYGSEKDAVMGNGPFVITEWSHENQIVLEKNPNYWNADAINITKMTGIANVEDDTALEMMQTGTIDFAPFDNPVYYEALTDEGFASTSYSNTYQFLHINQKGKSEDAGRFLSNMNFRLALSYAIDRTALCASVLPGQTPASRLADPGMMGVSTYFVEEYPIENGLNVTVDAEKAQYYLGLALEELGATVEDVPELSMLCYEAQTSQTVLQACQDMFLTTLGINCVIDPQPIQQMIGKVFSYDYDFWYGGLGVGTLDIGSNDGVLEYYSSENPDALFGYDNAEFNAYLNTAQTTLDAKEHFDAIFAAEKLFCAEIPDLLITWQTIHCVYRSDIVLNGIDTGFGADLAFADIVTE